jgi:predicted transcriptional regulator
LVEYIVYNVNMSEVVSLRLPDEQAKRLKRQARRMGRTPSETGRLLLEEALRQIEFAHIEFRDSEAGRQAYVKGRRLQVWMVMLIASRYGKDLKKTAAHLQLPMEWVQAAFHYAAAFPDEIRDAIEDNDSVTPQKLERMLPGQFMDAQRLRG